MSPTEFPYRVMFDDQQRAETQACAVDVKRLLDDIARAVMTIGQRLELVESELSPTLFRAWLHSEFLWSERIADMFLCTVANFGGAVRPDECRPQAALEMSRSPIAEAFAAQQLTKAQKLLAAYRAILRGEPALLELPRRWRRASLREPLLRGCRRRASRRRRRSTGSDHNDE